MPAAVVSAQTNRAFKHTYSLLYQTCLLKMPRSSLLISIKNSLRNVKNSMCVSDKSRAETRADSKVVAAEGRPRGHSHSAFQPSCLKFLDGSAEMSLAMKTVSTPKQAVMGKCRPLSKQSDSHGLSKATDAIAWKHFQQLYSMGGIFEHNCSSRESPSQPAGEALSLTLKSYISSC